MTIPEYTPAGCAPITLITQAVSHFNYSLSSGPTIHCTVFIIYVVYIMCFICQFDCIVMWYGILRSVQWSNCDLFTYLFAFHTSDPSSNMYNALFYILYLVMYFIDSMLIFILHTKSSCYLFVSSIIKRYIFTLSCLVFLFFVTWKHCDLTIHY